jgi:hypothetical protein
VLSANSASKAKVPRRPNTNYLHKKTVFFYNIYSVYFMRTTRGCDFPCVLSFRFVTNAVVGPPPKTRLHSYLKYMNLCATLFNKYIKGFCFPPKAKHDRVCSCDGPQHPRSIPGTRLLQFVGLSMQGRRTNLSQCPVHSGEPKTDEVDSW